MNKLKTGTNETREFFLLRHKKYSIVKFIFSEKAKNVRIIFPIDFNTMLSQIKWEFCHIFDAFSEDSEWMNFKSWLNSMFSAFIILLLLIYEVNFVLKI